MLESSHLTSTSKSESAKNAGSTSEHYDALVRRLQVSWADVGPQAIGVTSCLRREGVTTVACNLAIAAAKVTSGPVLLVDANIERPAVDRAFRVKSPRGLVNALTGDQPVFDCLEESRIANLSLLLSGRLKKNQQQPSYDLPAIRELFDNLKHVFHVIVVDLPPAQPLTTCFSLAPCLNGVLLVIEAEKVHRDVAVRTRRQLTDINADVIGVVYNKRPARLGERSA